jgi:hypothetical protein
MALPLCLPRHPPAVRASIPFLCTACNFPAPYSRFVVAGLEPGAASAADSIRSQLIFGKRSALGKLWKERFGKQKLEN